MARPLLCIASVRWLGGFLVPLLLAWTAGAAKEPPSRTALSARSNRRQPATQIAPARRPGPRRASQPATARDATSAFLLANEMQAGPAEPEGFAERLSAAKEKLEARPGVDDLVADPQRRARYAGAAWELREVKLADLWVWEGMGNRPASVRGSVPAVARRLASDPKIQELVLHTDNFRGHLPIVILKGLHDGRYGAKGGRSRLDLDDGSHRAVALWLAGHRTALAYVGTPPAE